MTARDLDQLIAFNRDHATQEMPFFGQEIFEMAAQTKGLRDSEYVAARAKSLKAASGAIDGMLTDFAVLEEDGVVMLPAHLSYEEGATLPCAGVTAWNALVEIGQMKAGETIVLRYQTVAAVTVTQGEYRNRAIVQGSLSFFGTYAVDEAKKTVTFNIVASTYPNAAGTSQTRTIDKLTADEFVNTNPGASRDGPARVA
mgnify:CR=1 FL=1